MSSPPVLVTFDPALPAVLQTDDACPCDTGYALLLENGRGKFQHVQCGLRFHTNAETLTPPLNWSCWQWYGLRQSSSSIWLAYSTSTSSRFLVLILNQYSLDAIEDPRLQQLKDKISTFGFTASWRAGNEVRIPDFLSRFLVSRPMPEDEILINKVSLSVRNIVTLQAVQSLARDQAPASSPEVT